LGDRRQARDDLAASALGAEGYGEIIEAATGELVTPVLAGELAVRLSDLGISPAVSCRRGLPHPTLATQGCVLPRAEKEDSSRLARHFRFRAARA